MPICILALWSDSLTYTIAKALAFSGHDVVVKIADVERDTQSNWSMSKRIGANEGAVVIYDDGVALPRGLDRLVVQSHPMLLGNPEILGSLANRAERLTLVSYGDRSRPFRKALEMQWRERKWCGSWFNKVDRVAYKDGYYAVDLFSLLRPRDVVGFDAHSHFLNDHALYQALHLADWSPEALRPIRANFLGSRDPASRGAILDSVARFFVRSVVLPSGKCKEMLWHAYTDAQPAALSPLDFLKALSDSDFTLAPPGFSLVTHRPVEALLRGSIPVLNQSELDLYDLDLVDGINCVAVPKGGWAAAMRRITTMSDDDVIAIRNNIRSMVDERVSYPALARDIGRRLGVADRTEGFTALGG